MSRAVLSSKQADIFDSWADVYKEEFLSYDIVRSGCMRIASNNVALL